MRPSLLTGSEAATYAEQSWRHSERAAPDITACASIDEIEADPHRFPIDLVGYPEQSDGDVVTRDGEVLGRWRMSGDEALEFVEFIPEGVEEVLFQDHFPGLLCKNIRDWHEGTQPN